MTLRKRYASAKLPNTYIVDMRGEAMEGNTSVYSSTVLDALKKTLQRGEQAILLLNRRGYHTSVRCPSCGRVWQMPPLQHFPDLSPGQLPADVPLLWL